jgi:pimeloyl-ACP methyl ester carboxylesterase
MQIRKYGNSAQSVVVLHGGPAMSGDVAPIAQGLSDLFTAIEPWQRGSGAEPLTVARHVEDLHSVIVGLASAAPPALVGHSWGAMLALCYAAAYPDEAGPIVLVGSGTFDQASRARMKEILRERTGPHLQERLAEVAASTDDASELHMKRLRLTRDLSVYDRLEPWPEQEEYEPLDVRAHKETWDDMMRLQSDGTYPKAFGGITSEVLMLHGDYDPHPGTMIYASLRPFIRNLEFQELERCGHSPWRERFARDVFFSSLRVWLLARTRWPQSSGRV